MFAESLLEISWAQRSRRSWTTATSFGLQAIVIGGLLTVPLLRTVGLPPGRVLPTPISWGAPPPLAPQIQREHVTTLNQSNISDNRLITPPSIPPQVAHIVEATAPPQVNYNGGSGVEGGTGTGSRDGVWQAIDASLRPPVTLPAPPATIRQFRTSSMLQGSLAHRVEPVYPPMARIARVQGAVVLEAVISKTGTIENLRLISGHPLLVSAAIEAVSQWRYRPYLLNGEAIEVETQITVNFILGN
jgi:periplasmic protein TonB